MKENSNLNKNRVMEPRDHFKNGVSPKNQRSRGIFLKIILLGVMTITISSCTTLHRTIREPNAKVEFNKADFALSNQVTAEAVTIKVLGIDWARLFTKRTGSVEGGGSSISFASIPVIGNVVSDKTANYALYELMKNNPDYDVVFYPQYETTVFKPALGIGFLTKITTVKTTARLGKLREN